MKQLFLASDISYVVSDIAKKINKKNPRVIFITTPVEPIPGDLPWLRRHKEALIQVGFSFTEYTITGKTREEIEQTLKGFDILYMSGGNGFYLLEKIQESNCAEILQKFVEEGNIYIGNSCGSYIASPDIYPTLRPDYVGTAPSLKGYKGLGLVDFIVFPHWGSDEFKDLYLNHRLKHAYNTDNKIILLTDKQYIHVENDFLKIIEVK